MTCDKIEKNTNHILFFPPCNLTASQRVYSWANYLKNSGYVIVITRKWEKHVKSFKCHYSTTPQVLVEKENYEVHFCPYKANFRDLLHTKDKMSFLKTLSFLKLFFRMFPLILSFFQHVFSCG